MRVEIDVNDFFKKMKRFGRRNVEKFVNDYINDCLFAVRTFAITHPSGIEKEFTVRAKGLVRKHLRVKKAFGMVGYFGSISSPRFSGWEEQQTGKRTKRKIKVHTKHARGAGGRRKLAKRFRRKNENAKNLLDPIGRITGDENIIAANLSRLNRDRYSGPVILPERFGNRKPGIYNMYKSGKLKIMQIWETKQPERQEWANNIITRWIRTKENEKLLKKKIDEVVK